jgi:FixJ family two-component response regulator
VTTGANLSRVQATGPLPIVYIVDDDASVRDSLSSLFRSVGLKVELFGSANDLLRSRPPDAPSCIVLDIRLPGVSGLDFQGQLARSGVNTPIVFMTGHGDIPMSVRAMKAGAIDFLTKPFRDQEMLMNKQIAGEMGLSEITVKIHRGHVMRKMGVRTLADLVRMAERLGLSSAGQ